MLVMKNFIDFYRVFKGIFLLIKCVGKMFVLICLDKVYFFLEFKFDNSTF